MGSRGGELGLSRPIALHPSFSAQRFQCQLPPPPVPHYRQPAIVPPGCCLPPASITRRGQPATAIRWCQGPATCDASYRRQGRRPHPKLVEGRGQACFEPSCRWAAYLEEDKVRTRAEFPRFRHGFSLFYLYPFPSRKLRPAVHMIPSIDVSCNCPQLILATESVCAVWLRFHRGWQLTKG